MICINIINDVCQLPINHNNFNEHLDKFCPPFIPGNERPTAVSLASILALANSAQHVTPEHNSLAFWQHLCIDESWWDKNKYTLEHKKQHPKTIKLRCFMGLFINDVIIFWGVSRPPLPLIIMSSFGYPPPLLRVNCGKNCFVTKTDKVVMIIFSHQMIYLFKSLMWPLKCT